MAEKKRGGQGWLRYSSIGIEFAAAVVVFTLVGLWIDRSYDCRPWGVLIGAVLGLVGGMYNLIRESLAAMKMAERDAKESESRRDDPEKQQED